MIFAQVTLEMFLFQIKAAVSRWEKYRNVITSIQVTS